jgi:DnaJ like chaperone protein
LVTAYDFIAKKTFQTRLKKYTNQLEEYGYFKYQDVIIHSDGRVVSSERTFHLRNAKYEPFNITIKQKGIFAPLCYIDLTIDRDVILSLINYILEKNVEQRKKTKKIESALPNIICMLAKISKADGVVTKEEIGIIKKFLLDDLNLRADVFNITISIFNKAKNSSEPIGLYARNIFNEFGNDPDFLINTVNLLFSVAISDGYFSVEEELMINEVETIFGVSGKTSYSSYKREHHNKTKQENDSDIKYFEILGLNPNVDLSEIKVTYRRLVMQYHPDKVQHLGHEFQTLAEEKMKEINIAYGYFKNKYNL